MKIWILMIFYLNSNLDRLCDKLDNKIEKLALDMSQPCEVLYEKIIALSQKRDDLINLRVLHNNMVDSLTKEESQEMQELATKFFASHSTSCFRGKIKILKKCIQALIKAGYSAEKFKEVYPYLLPKIPRQVLQGV